MTKEDKKALKQKEQEELDKYMITPEPKKGRTWNTITDEHTPSSKSKFVHMETIEYPYSDLTINYIAEIACFMERLNLGTYAVFRVLWDIIKRGFWQMTLDNKLRFLKTLCESNFNLLYFQDEVEEMITQFVDSDDGTDEVAREMGWSTEWPGVIKRSSTLEFDFRTELYNTVFAEK
jgi:hypothetical protein